MKTSHLVIMVAFLAFALAACTPKWVPTLRTACAAGAARCRAAVYEVRQEYLSSTPDRYWAERSYKDDVTFRWLEYPDLAAKVCESGACGLCHKLGMAYAEGRYYPRTGIEDFEASPALASKYFEIGCNMKLADAYSSSAYLVGKKDYERCTKCCSELAFLFSGGQERIEHSELFKKKRDGIGAEAWFKALLAGVKKDHARFSALRGRVCESIRMPACLEAARAKAEAKKEGGWKMGKEQPQKPTTCPGDLKCKSGWTCSCFEPSSKKDTGPCEVRTGHKAVLVEVDTDNNRRANRRWILVYDSAGRKICDASDSYNDGTYDEQHSFTYDDKGRIAHWDLTFLGTGRSDRIFYDYDSTGARTGRRVDNGRNGVVERSCLYSPPCPAPYKRCHEREKCFDLPKVPGR